jgi:hypothetical protein
MPRWKRDQRPMAMNSSDIKRTDNQGTSHTGLGHLPSRLLLAISIVVIAILALAGYALWQSRQTLRLEAAKEAESMAKLLDRYVYTAIH